MQQLGYFSSQILEAKKLTHEHMQKKLLKPLIKWHFYSFLTLIFKWQIGDPSTLFSKIS